MDAGIKVKVESDDEVEPYNGTYACLLCFESVRGMPALACSKCSSNPWHRACDKDLKYAEVCPTCNRKSVTVWTSASVGGAAPSDTIDLTREGAGAAELAMLTPHEAREDAEPSVGGAEGPIRKHRAAEASPAPRDAKRARLEARVSTKELPGMGEVYSVLAGKGGELFLGSRTALYLQVHGRLALIAGHSSESGFKDGQGVEARFDCIAGLAVEDDGSVVVSDSGNHSVRRVSPRGQVTTVAGNGTKGFADGVGNTARFYVPIGIEVDRQGLIYVADTNNHCIRTVQPADGTVSTLCGKGKEAGCVNGTPAKARFRLPTGLALNTSEDLIVAEGNTSSLRKVALPDGHVTTVAGSLQGGGEGAGYADGTGTAARCSSPQSMAVGGSNANPVAARFSEPYKVKIDEGGQLLVAENLNWEGVQQAAKETGFDKALRDLQTDYGKLLEDPMAADVTFVVDGQRFPVNSGILMERSEHFKALLTKPGLA